MTPEEIAALGFPRPPMARPNDAGNGKHCRFYSYEPGLKGGPLCAVGVDNRTSPGASRVCMPPPEKAINAVPVCPKRKNWTAEETAEFQKFRQERLVRMSVAFTAVPEDSKEARGTSGEVPCPACGTGTIRWSRARSNGHIWAVCTTPYCFGVQQ